jgi:hypothetical protein
VAVPWHRRCSLALELIDASAVRLLAGGFTGLGDLLSPPGLETTAIESWAIRLLGYGYPLFCVLVLLNFVLSILINGYSHLKPLFASLKTEEAHVLQNKSVRALFLYSAPHGQMYRDALAHPALLRWTAAHGLCTEM